MGVFLKVLMLLPSVIQGVLQVVREVKKNGQKIERKQVKVAVHQGIKDSAVRRIV